MLRPISLLLCFLCAVLLVGCNKSDTNTNATPANSNKPATATTPASTTASTAGEKIGVPECDSFITAYESCISGKVPAEARAQQEAAIAQFRASWKKLAANPATKPTLAAACKQSADQARTAMKAYGCTF